MAKEILVVASKVKKLAKEKGVNTSATAIERLSEIVEELIVKGAANAKGDKRKTLMDRDFEEI